MQTQEITVAQAADFVEKYMRNEEHIQRLVATKSKTPEEGEAIFGQILEAALERVKPAKTKR